MFEEHNTLSSIFSGIASGGDSDSEVLYCQYEGCITKFSMLVRRHICRRCGRCFCSNHCNESYSLVPVAADVWNLPTKGAEALLCCVECFELAKALTSSQSLTCFSAQAVETFVLPSPPQTMPNRILLPTHLVYVRKDKFLAPVVSVVPLNGNKVRLTLMTTAQSAAAYLSRHEDGLVTRDVHGVPLLDISDVGDQFLVLNAPIPASTSYSLVQLVRRLRPVLERVSDYALLFADGDHASRQELLVHETESLQDLIHTLQEYYNTYRILARQSGFVGPHKKYLESVVSVIVKAITWCTGLSVRMEDETFSLGPLISITNTFKESVYLHAYHFNRCLRRGDILSAIREHGIRLKQIAKDAKLQLSSIEKAAAGGSTRLHLGIVRELKSIIQICSYFDDIGTTRQEISLQMFVRNAAKTMRELHNVIESTPKREEFRSRRLLYETEEVLRLAAILCMLIVVTRRSRTFLIRELVNSTTQIPGTSCMHALDWRQDAFAWVVCDDLEITRDAYAALGRRISRFGALVIERLNVLTPDDVLGSIDELTGLIRKMVTLDSRAVFKKADKRSSRITYGDLQRSDSCPGLCMHQPLVQDVRRAYLLRLFASRMIFALPDIKDKLMAKSQSKTKARDADYVRQASWFSEVSPVKLGISPVFLKSFDAELYKDADFWETQLQDAPPRAKTLPFGAAMTLLSKLPEQTSPTDMLYCIYSSVNLCHDLMKEYDPVHIHGADDLMPVYVYVVVHSGITYPYAIIDFLDSYSAPHERNCELGYAMATFEAAVSYIDAAVYEQYYNKVTPKPLKPHQPDAIVPLDSTTDLDKPSTPIKVLIKPAGIVLDLPEPPPLIEDEPRVVLMHQSTKVLFDDSSAPINKLRRKTTHKMTRSGSQITFHPLERDPDALDDNFGPLQQISTKNVKPKPKDTPGPLVAPMVINRDLVTITEGGEQCMPPELDDEDVQVTRPRHDAPIVVDVNLQHVNVHDKHVVIDVGLVADAVVSPPPPVENEVVSTQTFNDAIVDIEPHTLESVNQQECEPTSEPNDQQSVCVPSQDVEPTPQTTMTTTPPESLVTPNEPPRSPPEKDKVSLLTLASELEQPRPRRVSFTVGGDDDGDDGGGDATNDVHKRNLDVIQEEVTHVRKNRTSSMSRGTDDEMPQRRRTSSKTNEVIDVSVMSPRRTNASADLADEMLRNSVVRERHASQVKPKNVNSDWVLIDDKSDHMTVIPDDKSLPLPSKPLEEPSHRPPPRDIDVNKPLIRQRSHSWPLMNGPPAFNVEHMSAMHAINRTEIENILNGLIGDAKIDFSYIDYEAVSPSFAPVIPSLTHDEQMKAVGALFNTRFPRWRTDFIQRCMTYYGDLQLWEE